MPRADQATRCFLCNDSYVSRCIDFELTTTMKRKNKTGRRSVDWFDALNREMREEWAGKLLANEAGSVLASAFARARLLGFLGATRRILIALAHGPETTSTLCDNLGVDRHAVTASLWLDSPGQFVWRFGFPPMGLGEERTSRRSHLHQLTPASADQVTRWFQAVFELLKSESVERLAPQADLLYLAARLVGRGVLRAKRDCALVLGARDVGISEFARKCLLRESSARRYIHENVEAGLMVLHPVSKRMKSPHTTDAGKRRLAEIFEGVGAAYEDYRANGFPMSPWDLSAVVRPENLIPADRTAVLSGVLPKPPGWDEWSAASPVAA